MANDEVATKPDATKPDIGKIRNAATSALERRKELQKFAKMDLDDIAKLKPEEVRELMKKGADLDEDGKPKQKDSSLKIHIELDLDVEVHLSARVQGDITIGLL